jgi:uncharacterized caspase-like protein
MSPRHCRCFILVGLLGLLVVFTASAQDRGLELVRLEGRRFAFVIGNDSYEAAPLRNAQNDANDLAAALKELNFSVTTLLNAGREEFDRQFNAFTGSLRTDDVALFYFAGHGVQIERENYLLPVDIAAKDQADVRARGISVSEVIDRIKARGTSVRLLILDACRNNPYLGNRSGSGGLAPVSALGTLVAYATAPDSTASDDAAGKNGLYTGVLLDLLKTPGLEARELFVRARQRVFLASRQSQVPWYEDGLIGNFVFRPGSPPPIDASDARRQQEEEELWQRVKDRRDREVFEDYLNRYGANGRYATVARLKLDSLSAGTAGPLRPQTTHRRPSLAIIGFRNVAGRSEQDWISTALAEQVATELNDDDQLVLLSSEAVGTMKAELALPNQETFSPPTLARIRSNGNADLVILGSYLARGADGNAEIRVDLRIQDTASGETLARTAESGNEREFNQLVQRVGRTLRTSLGLKRTRTAPVSSQRSLEPESEEGARAYYEGLARLAEFDAMGARQSLQRTVALEPDFPLAHAALGLALAELGYDAESAQQAAEAHRLSTNLPRESRLLIEARFLETSRTWAKAAASYQTLFDFYPQNLEYGLALVRTQLSANQVEGARSTLDTLRRMKTVFNDDPRIEIAAADIAQMTGDFRQMLERARSAADAGTRRDSWLVVARATAQQAWALQNLGEFEEARGRNVAARALYLNAGYRLGVSRVLIQFGGLARRQGRLEEAAAAFREALNITREVGEKDLIARNLASLANVAFDRGDLVEARTAYSEALSTYRALGQERGVARLLNNLAAVLYEEGETKTAISFYEESLAIKRKIGDELGVIVTLQNIGESFADRGDLQKAVEHYTESLQLSRRGSTRSEEAYALFGIAEVRLLQGNIAEAQELHQRALSIRKELGEKGTIAESQTALAELMIAAGRPQEAESLLDSAIEEFVSEKRVDDQARCLALKALIQLSTANVTTASAALASANAVGKNSRRRDLRVLLTLTEAQIEAEQGRVAAVRERLDDIIRELTRGELIVKALEARLVRWELTLRFTSDQNAALELENVRAEASARRLQLIEDKTAAVLKRYR